MRYFVWDERAQRPMSLHGPYVDLESGTLQQLLVRGPDATLFTHPYEATEAIDHTIRYAEIHQFDLWPRRKDLLVIPIII